MVERLTLTLTDFLVEDGANGRGVWKGYANTFGYLDMNYGGINVPGCFSASINDFLVNGFVPDSHGAASGFEYTILGTYGYPTTCREDAKGLYFEGEFHGDAEAQVIRQRMQERAAAGKSVGMSIGWRTENSFRVYPKDYQSELPKYLAPEFQRQGLQDALQWPSVLIRTQNNLIETSLTLTPANTASLVTEVQSVETTMDKPNSTKLKEQLGKYIDADSELALTQINVLINCLFYEIAYSVFCDPIPSPMNREVWRGALLEFVGYCLQIYDSFSASESSEGEPMNDEDGVQITPAEMPLMASRFLHENFVNPEHLIVPGVTGTKELAAHALSVVRRLYARESSLAERRVEKQRLGRLSGKVVSQPNHAALSELAGAMKSEMDDHTKQMGACIQSLKEFLEKFNPSASEENSKKLRALRLKQLAAKSLQP